MFCRNELPGVLDHLNVSEARKEFIELLKLLALAHRVNRDDEFLQNTHVPFETVRDTMYKYSQQAKTTFFDQPVYSFLFQWFACSAKGVQFAKERFAENSDERHSARMFREINDLAAEARESLTRQ